MNSVVLIGRLTEKPELKYSPSGTAVTKFSLAVPRNTKEGGADFIRITAFGKRAENICRYMEKGRQIAVQGRIQTGSYKDRDGRTVYTTDVICDHDEFLGKAEEPRSEEPQYAFSPYDDGLPV